MKFVRGQAVRQRLTRSAAKASSNRCLRPGGRGGPRRKGAVGGAGLNRRGDPESNWSQNAPLKRINATKFVQTAALRKEFSSGRIAPQVRVRSHVTALSSRTRV